MLNPRKNKVISLETQPKYVNEESRKYECCGCIPLHAGVVIIAVLELLLAVICIRGVLNIRRLIMEQGMVMDDGNHNNISLQWLIFLVLYFIACCFGIIGALNEYKGMIGVFRPCYICGGILFPFLLVALLSAAGVVLVLEGFDAFIWFIVVIAVRIYFTRMVKKYYNVMKSRDNAL